MMDPVGLNVREALEDTTLPTGGGKSGKEPLAVAKGTTVSKSDLCPHSRNVT